ncbi:unnamed protein product, partial [Callosobruchus maculatus]
ELKRKLRFDEIGLNELASKEKQLQDLHTKRCHYSGNNGFTTEEIVRYSRQMIMPNIQIDGQERLKNGKVMIIGTGGLGCPAAIYLTSAGVGEITLVDYDEVELSNLHRQILHFESDINIPKVQSACNKLEKINSNVKIIPLKVHADSESLSRIIQDNRYNVVLDCSDNVATRYLVNDICVMNNTPLVSGSALQMEGQLTVYHHNDGPCYRCLFPVPPPPHTVTNCGDGGVLGPVPGVIGVLQALEAIKILLESSDVLSGRLLLFDGSTTTFRNVKLRPKNDKCDVCGSTPTITRPIDYEQFCGASAHDKIVNINLIEPEGQIDVKDFPKDLQKNVVIDVRPELEYKMCSLPGTVNFPYSVITKDCNKVREYIENKVTNGVRDIYFLCRRGNDSQRAMKYLKENTEVDGCQFHNIRGGLHAYSKYIDPSFPYSVLLKKENAHDESIWSCAWGRYSGEKKKKNDDDHQDDKSRDSIMSDEPPIDYIVTGGVDDLVKVWELQDDRLILKHNLEGHSLGVVSVAISNNGKMCASSSLDSSMRIWDLEKGEKITNIDVGPLDLWTVAFSPDDKYIISGSHAGLITSYSVETTKAEHTFGSRGKFTLSIAYSPDGRYIASGAIDGIINIFDVHSNKLWHALEGHAMPIRSLCFSPDSQLLLTASDDGHMKLYDVQHLSDVVVTLSGHASWVLSVAFSPDGKYFVSGSSDKTVKVWDVASKQCIHTFKEHNDQVWGVKYSPDGSKIVSVSEDRSINIYSCPV